MAKENLIQLDKKLFYPGQRIIDLGNGQFIPVGIGGNNLPSGGGSSIDFYKCTAVEGVPGSELYLPFGDLLDHSPFSIAVSIKETVTIQDISPDNNISKSANFSGSGVYGELNTPLGEDDFTIEAWIYPTEPGTTIYSCRSGNQSNAGRFSFNLENLQPGVWETNWAVRSPDAIASNTWSHVALVRKNGLLILYVNGIRKDEGNFSSNTISVKKWAVGFGHYDGSTSGTEYFYGNICDLRVNRRAVYSTDFTPTFEPYAPLGVDKRKWTGQQYISNTDGTFSLTDTIKSDLQYGIAITPMVGKIYSANANVAVKELAEKTGDPSTIPQPPVVETKYKVSGVSAPSMSIGEIDWETFNGVYTSVSKDIVKQENWAGKVHLGVSLKQSVTNEDIQYPHKKESDYETTTRLFIINGKVFITNDSSGSHLYSGKDDAIFSELPNGLISMSAYDEMSDESETQSIRIEKM